MCKRHLLFLFITFYFVTPTKPQSISNCGKVIYSFDFANGIPSDWQNKGDKPMSVWEYRGLNTTPTNNVGSRGGYSDTIPIYSSTNSNGFVIFDSDYLDNNGTSSFGSGPSPAPHSGNLITQKLDFSKNNAVKLIFESKARFFYSAAWIKFSSDSGVSYFDSLRVHQNLSVSQTTKNPEVVELNISSQVAQKAKVWVAFSFDGANPIVSPGYYYWMIDDIQFIEPAITDLAIEKPVFRFNNHLGNYSIIPQDQADSIHIGIQLSNEGIFPSTNAHLRIRYLINAVQKQVDTINLPTINPLSDTSFSFNSNFMIIDTGLYDVILNVFQDSTDCDTTNNKVNFKFKVTEPNRQFASDFEWLTDSISGYIRTNSFVGAEKNGFMMLNLFEFKEPYELETLWLKVGKQTSGGVKARVVIFDTLGVFNNLGPGGELTNQSLPVFAGMQYQFDGTEADSGEVYLPVNVLLQKGEYYIGINCSTSNGIDTISIAHESTLNMHQPEASLIYIADSLNKGLYTNPNGAYLMRLNKSNCSGVSFTITGNLDDTQEIGAITNVQIAGGKGPYFTFWTGPNLFYSTSLNLQNLTTPGYYKLTVYDKNGCVGKQDFYVPTSIDEQFQSKNQLKISPNPSNGRFSIHLENHPENNQFNLEVFDISGRLVFQNPNLNLEEKASFDLSHLPKGEYLIKLSNSEKFYTNTVILK